LNSLVKKPFLRLKEYVPGKDEDYVKKRYGVEKVIKLASNENPHGASPRAIQAFREYDRLHIYPPSHPEELIQKISEYTGFEESRIVVGAGIDGILEAIFKIFIDKGDRVLIAPPTFPYYHTLAEISSADTVRVERDENFMISNPPREFKLAIVCSPNNPTGNLEREEVVRSLIDSGGIVFIDEAYVEFSSRTLLHLADSENVVVARTFSKAFGLANLRIGYAVVPEWLRKFYLKAKTPFPLSTPAIKAAEAALDDIEYMEKTVDKVRKERQRVFSALRKEGLEVFPSEANFLFVRLKVESSRFCEELMKRGIIIRDCSGFEGCSNRDVRISIGKKEENDILLQSVGEVLEVLG